MKSDAITNIDHQKPIIRKEQKKNRHSTVANSNNSPLLEMRESLSKRKPGNVLVWATKFKETVTQFHYI